MSAYTPPCQHAKDEQCALCYVPTKSDYDRGVADERKRIAEALDRAASSGGYSEMSCYVLEQWATLVRGGDLP